MEQSLVDEATVDIQQCNEQMQNDLPSEDGQTLDVNITDNVEQQVHRITVA